MKNAGAINFYQQTSTKKRDRFDKRKYDTW